MAAGCAMALTLKNGIEGGSVQIYGVKVLRIMHIYEISTVLVQYRTMHIS